MNLAYNVVTFFKKPKLGKVPVKLLWERSSSLRRGIPVAIKLAGSISPLNKFWLIFLHQSRTTIRLTDGAD